MHPVWDNDRSNISLCDGLEVQGSILAPEFCTCQYLLNCWIGFSLTPWLGFRCMVCGRFPTRCSSYQYP